MTIPSLRSFATLASWRFIPLKLAPAASASTTWTGPSWNVSTAIPDNDDTGLSDMRNIAMPGMNEIESITVHLTLSGGWNGDLYAYLVHGSGFSVLLNRPGRSSSNPDGSATVGMEINLADSAASDIHTAIPMSGGSVNGIYQPDGRVSDPLIGLDPNGSWTLFIADQSAGGQSTLQNWSISIAAVPEPSAAALLGGLGSLLLLRRTRQGARPSI